MKKLVAIAAFAVSASALTLTAAQAAPKMHRATVMVGSVTDSKGTYMVVKMGGKMYGMLPMSDFDRVWAERNRLGKE